MPDIRFGLPGPNDPEQVVLQTRWGDRTQINHGEWRNHFPVGVFIDGAGGSIRVRNVNGSGTLLDSANGSQLRHMLTHPDAGLIPNGLNYLCWVNQQPWNVEGVQNNSALVIEAAARPVWQVVAPHDKLSAAGNDGIYSTRWFGTWPYDPAVHTEANALDLAADLLAFYNDNPSVLGFSLGDDIETIENSSSQGNAVQAGILIRAMQSLDARPVTAAVVSAEAAAEVGPGMKLHLSPLYPCGRDASNNPLPEGDFHRSTFGGLDYVDIIAGKMAILPEGGRHWLIIQTHQTINDPPSSSQLRYPTPNEMRALVWDASGEGIKGLFWFVYTDQLPNSDGLGSTPSAARLAVAAEMSSRLTPNIRMRLLSCEKTAAAFTAAGGGLGATYANAYISTLADATHGLTYCVVRNHATAATDVTISSATLTGSLRSLETGVETALPATITFPALDGSIFQHIPPAQTELELTMLTASDNIVTGMRWMRTNGLARTGVAGNGSYEYDVTNGVTAVRSESPPNPVDDHDGNYGEAFKLHGLCLKYLRTHDASLIPDIEAQVQWHINIEQALVAQRGSYWAGSAPYWYWTLPTVSGSEFVGVGDPNINGGAGASITYNQGDVRVWSSIDQMHMVAHALYAYMYLLRNEPAITANTTLRADCLALISRMATFEASNASFFVPADQRVLGNLHQIAQGLTPTTNSGIVDADYSSTYKGQQFGNWQVSNIESNVNPSSNIAIDIFMRAVMAPDSQIGGVTNFLRGMAMDMLASDIGQHDVDWHTNYAPPVGAYPTGWVLRAAAGDSLEYASPRTIASNNGYATDLHYVFISNSAARDGMTGRAPQRLVVLCLLALMDPTYNVPIEIAPDGVTVLRSVNIVDACNQWAETMAAHLPEPTTNCIRFMAPMHLGVTGSHPTNVIDSAFTGYWAMAVEMWHLVNSGADYTDYYPIGTW